MVFNVVAANHDDHTKNFAFMRSEGDRWHLTPAYDVTHAHNPASQWTTRHLMSVNAKFEGITLEDLYAVGERNFAPGYRQIVRSVQDVVAEWPSFAAGAGVDNETTAFIAADLDRLSPR
jgi:serine/threonine-protein kinase HipA